jgi:hypothetical protein
LSHFQIKAHLGFGAYAMRYNVFDLYEGSVRGDKLKEVALKLDYAKPAKGQGANGNNEDIDEAKLLSGLNPSILSLLKFEVKFKNMDNAPISELIQDVNFKNAIFNVAVNAARLEKLFTELKQMHYKEQEIEKAVVELKQMIEKEKQSEKERTQQDVALRQQIESQNQQLQQMMKDYLQQRAEKIKALEDTIKDLNGRMKELVAYDKEIIEKYSSQFADKLDDFKDEKGEPIFTKQQQKDVSEKLFREFIKIDRKIEKELEANNKEIAELKKQLSSPQNGQDDKTASNKEAGIFSPAYNRTKQQISPQEKIKIEKRINELENRNEQLLVIGQQQKEKTTSDVAKEVGKELSPNKAQELAKRVEGSEEFRKAEIESNAVHAEIEVVHEEVQDLKLQANELREGKQDKTKSYSDLEVLEVQNQSFIEDNEKDLDEGVELDIDIDDIDIEGFDLGLGESLEISANFLIEDNDEPSASVRTKLN